MEKKIILLVLSIFLVLVESVAQEIIVKTDTIHTAEIELNELYTFAEYDSNAQHPNSGESELIKVKIIEPRYVMEEAEIELHSFTNNNKGDKLARIEYKPEKYKAKVYKRLSAENEKEGPNIRGIGFIKGKTNSETKLIRITENMKIPGTTNTYKVKRRKLVEPMKVVIEYPSRVNSNKNWSLRKIDASDYSVSRGFQLIEIEKALKNLGYEVKVNGELDLIEKKSLAKFKKDKGIPINCGPGGDIEDIRKALKLSL